MSTKNLSDLQLQAYKNLHIEPKNRVIISLDGGGIKSPWVMKLQHRAFINLYI